MVRKRKKRKAPDVLTQRNEQEGKVGAPELDVYFTYFHSFLYLPLYLQIDEEEKTHSQAPTGTVALGCYCPIVNAQG